MSYVGIGIEFPKTAPNIGMLWRSAYNFGANFVFTIGERYTHQPSDPAKAARHVPCFNYSDFGSFHNSLPLDCSLIGVEICNRATPLEMFKHPKRTVYILGPEDGSLSQEAQAACEAIVKFESRFCLNVGCAGTVVLYDRNSKKINRGLANA